MTVIGISDLIGQWIKTFHLVSSFATSNSSVCLFVLLGFETQFLHLHEAALSVTTQS